MASDPERFPSESSGQQEVKSCDQDVEKGEMGIAEIRSQMRDIISDVIGEDLSDIEIDLPLLDYVTSSLQLVEGVRRVQERFQVSISIGRVLAGDANLGALAAHVEEALKTRSNLKESAVPAVESEVAPESKKVKISLAPSQHHIGFLSRYSSQASTVYNTSLLIELTGALDVPSLNRSVQTVSDRYEALRASLSEDLYALEVGGEASLVLTDCSSESLDQRIEEMVRRPFSVGERLFRVELLKLSPERHVLGIVSHALVLEQDALRTVLEELSEAYCALCEDRSYVGSDALQLSEIASHLDKQSSPSARSDAEKFWKVAFEKGFPRLELPGDRPRPPIKSYEGARLLVPVDPIFRDRLEEWARSEETTSFELVLCAFTLMLHRLSGQETVVVGVDEDLGEDSSRERMVGSIHREAPLCSSYDGDISFSEYVARQKAGLAEARVHGVLSVSEMIEVLSLPRDQSRSGLLSAGFGARCLDSPPSFGVRDATLLLSPGVGARYDIELTLVEAENELLISCDYADEMYDEDTVKRWLDGLLCLLDAGLSRKTESCGLLPIMCERERSLAIEGWNVSERDYPLEETLYDRIASQISEQPDRPAIQYSGQTLTYGDLGQRIDSIARWFLQNGVEPRTRIGILMERTPDLIAAMLAGWRVGGTLVPLDPEFPVSRIRFMVEDAEVGAVIASPCYTQLVGDGGSFEVLALEDSKLEGLREDIPWPGPEDGSDCAHIIYTSGSTGRPKGVEILHRGLTNAILSTRDLLEFGSTSSLLAITTVTFDISAAELFMPLVAGGMLEIAESGLAGDGFGLAEKIEALDPTHLQATASTWKAALTAGWKGDRKRCLVSTGEGLPRELAEQLLSRCRVLWNLYGPSETTIFSTAYRVESAPGELMRIGQPLPNTRIFILDEKMQPVPVGVVGELYIGGVGVARGYWQRPELTRQRFVRNPFSPEEFFYRTGDLVRRLSNGDLVCLGRQDDQVKVHGVRVELGEVEAALREIEGVRDAVAVSWEDRHGERNLVGHIISVQEGALSATDVRSPLRDRLPAAMIPVHFLFHQDFPRTANDKIDRRALPAPDGDSVLARDGLVLPSTATERLLAEAWARVLDIGVESIGRDDDFMSLGGHSLLMTTLMVEVRNLFNVRFTLQEFFSAVTIRKFSALIDQRRRDRKSGGADSTRIEEEQRAEWGKQRMAFLQREAQLPRNLTPARGLEYVAPTEVKTAFLTGATGFLGGYIVGEVLRNTDVELHCLVRPKRGAECAKTRIENQLRYYEIWGEDEAWIEAWNERVKVVEGDVALPRMGIADERYSWLANEVDTIIHSASQVNFIYPYEALSATNVRGVQEVIRFAFLSRIKPVHFLSTAAVWPMGADHTYLETDSIDHGQQLRLGYYEAKWVGEKCLLNAADRGLPVARYRPGEIGGDSVTGRCVLEHFMIALTKGFLQFGAFPTIDSILDVAPADYVAQALVHLVFRGNSIGRSFHLTNPRSCHMSEALVFLRSLGYQFEELPFERLRDQLVCQGDFSSNALFPFQATLEDMVERHLQLPNYDCRQTLRELEGSGIVCPPLDDTLFGKYINYLRNIGYLPEPTGHAVGVLAGS